MLTILPFITITLTISFPSICFLTFSSLKAFSFISSSVVKEIASYHKPLTGLVPECVEKALKEVYQNQ